MRTVWQVNGSNKLLLFFSGWGMDESAAAHLSAGEWDICTCFDYNDLFTTDAERWREYEDITLVAWSMGVWAAEMVIAREGLTVNRAVAVNGTPTPVDELTGIPPAIANATLNTLTDASMRKFLRRMFGSASLMAQYEAALPQRDIKNTRSELFRIMSSQDATHLKAIKTKNSINGLSGIMSSQDATHLKVIKAKNSINGLSGIMSSQKATHTGALKWDSAIVSRGDTIFPYENLVRYWGGRCVCREIDAPHYPFHLFRDWKEVVYGK